MRRPIYAFIPLLLAGALDAQTQSLVSPVGYDTAEGNSNNTYPFYNRPFRYMQIHGDLRTNVLVMKAIAIRRDGNVSTNATARTLNLSLKIGDSSYANASTTYDNNWVGTPTTVVNNATINFPAWPKPASAPAPFNARIPFTGVWLYTGVHDLAWETAVTQTTGTSSYPADAVSDSTLVTGPYTRLGGNTGCTSTGQTSASSAVAYIQADLTNNRFRFYSYMNYGVINAPAAMLVGSSNPNVKIPVCGPGTLFTDALITLPGTTDSRGYMNSGSQYVPYNAAFVGAKVYTQWYSADRGQAQLPVSVTNGVESIAPAMPPAGRPFTRIYSSGNATSATGGRTDHYALVTYFEG